MAHTDYDDLKWIDTGNGLEVAVVSLATSDTAWNPGSTKRPIYGPAYMVYERRRSGISGYVYPNKAAADAAAGAS